jgi:hypothetical protein
MMFSFQDTHHRQMAQAIKWSNHGRLVVTIGVRAETTTSLPHREAQLEAAPIELLPENHDIVDQSA